MINGNDNTVRNPPPSSYNVDTTKKEIHHKIDHDRMSSSKLPIRFQHRDDENNSDDGDFVIFRKLLRRRHIFKERRERQEETKRENRNNKHQLNFKSDSDSDYSDSFCRKRMRQTSISLLYLNAPESSILISDTSSNDDSGEDDDDESK